MYFPRHRKKGMIIFCAADIVSITLAVISRCPYLITQYHYGIAIYQGLLTIFVVANFGFATFMDPGVYPRGIIFFFNYCNIFTSNLLIMMICITVSVVKGCAIVFSSSEFYFSLGVDG